MKNKHFKYIYSIGFLVLLLACSTRKDNFATRNFQALNTEFNVLYNGGVALDKGVATVKAEYKDNFWQILPVERQQPKIEKNDIEKTKNADFEKAELKATKAIQRRSMNIDGTERNRQIDEAYLMLGKARYFDQRFIPALEAFNYILYKYPKSDKIYEAKIWVEKTNMRLESDGLAIVNLTKLLQEIKLKNQVFADANAILAQAYIKTEKNDSAIVRLQKAIQYSKIDEEKARYRFIKAQLFEKINQNDSAFASYQSVIDMKRKSPRQYVLQAHNRQAKQFDFEKGDTVAFLENYNKLLLDRENRPFLDILNHQLGLVFDKAKKTKQAKFYYNKSLRTNSQDMYLEASNYRNIADINFYSAKYVAAGKYYDSTMTKLVLRSKEYNFIKKKRENLDDVIKYEGIALKNDSILKVIAMSDTDKTKFYEDFISKLKLDEAKQKILEEKSKGELLSKETNKTIPKNDFAGNVSTNSNFYFYNQVTVAYGKVEFRKIWGDRTLKENWRNGALLNNNKTEGNDNQEDTTIADETIIEAKIKKSEIEEKYTSDFYIKQLPKSQPEIDILIKDRNYAYFQLGVIYKEKFKEYKLAQTKLELLLEKKPEERLVLPAMYNLYRIYEITDIEKAISMKALILKLYPNSRYAQILNNLDQNETEKQSPEIVFSDLYQRYLAADYRNLNYDINKAIEKFTGDEILPKLELLKANNTGKTHGLVEFKKILNYVALTYPESQQGKESEEFVRNDVVEMEQLQFNLEKPLSWKILFRIDCSNDQNAKPLIEKINKFSNSTIYENLKTSTDLYLIDEDFVVVHGIKSEQQALDMTTILRDFKDYKIQEQPIIISSDNYKIVQIKKNIEEYLCDPKKTPNPVIKKVIVKKPVEEPVINNNNIENQKTKSKLQNMGPPGSMPQLQPTEDDFNDSNFKVQKTSKKI